MNNIPQNIVAELNGAYEHVIRSYLSTGEFPSTEEIASLARTCKETRISGLPEINERKVGLVSERINQKTIKNLALGI